MATVITPVYDIGRCPKGFRVCLDLVFYTTLNWFAKLAMFRYRVKVLPVAPDIPKTHTLYGNRRYVHLKVFAIIDISSDDIQMQIRPSWLISRCAI
jgi:hypothetical protein